MLLFYRRKKGKPPAQAHVSSGPSLNSYLGLLALRPVPFQRNGGQIPGVPVRLQVEILDRRKGFPGGSMVKNLSADAGDSGSIPGSGRSSGEGNGNPLQHSCLGNPMDRGTCWATVHEVTKESDKTQ